MISKLNLWERVTSAIWSLKQKPDNLLFFLLLILLPTQLGYHFWPDWSLVSGIRVDYYAPTIFLTDIIIFLLALVWLPQQKINIKNHTILLIGVASFVFLNIALSINRPVSIYKWTKLLEFGFVAFYVFKSRGELKKKIAGYLLIPLGYTLFLTVLQIVNQGTIGGIFNLLGERSFNIMTPGIALANVLGQQTLRPYATFPHPNVLAGFGLISLLITLAYENRKRVKLTGVILASAIVLLSFSDGAFIALIICLAAYFLGFRKGLGHIYKQIVLGLVIVAIIMMPGSQSVIASGRELPESIARRFELSTIAGEAFAKSPVLGTGEGSFISFIPRSLVQRNLWFLQPVHNIFLLVLAETGAIGLVAFVVLLFRLGNSRDSKGHLIILAILIIGMLDHYFLTLQQTQLLFAIVIGILFDNEKNFID